MSPKSPPLHQPHDHLFRLVFADLFSDNQDENAATIKMRTRE